MSNIKYAVNVKTPTTLEEVKKLKDYIDQHDSIRVNDIYEKLIDSYEEGQLCYRPNKAFIFFFVEEDETLATEFALLFESTVGTPEYVYGVTVNLLPTEENVKKLKELIDKCGEKPGRFVYNMLVEAYRIDQLQVMMRSNPKSIDVYFEFADQKKALLLAKVYNTKVATRVAGIIYETV